MPGEPVGSLYPIAAPLILLGLMAVFLIGSCLVHGVRAMVRRAPARDPRAFPNCHTCGGPISYPSDTLDEDNICDACYAAARSGT